MAFKIYPTYQMVGLPDRKVQEYLEVRRNRTSGYPNHVVSGLIPSEVHPLSLAITAGDAELEGYLVILEPAVQLDNVFTASGTYYVWLQLTIDPTSFQCSAANFVVNQSATTPSNAMAIATVVRDATEITSVTDTRTMSSFAATGGHRHTGVAGDGTLLPGTSVGKATNSAIGAVLLSVADGTGDAKVLAYEEKAATDGVCELVGTTVPLARIPATLTGKDAGSVGGHSADSLVAVDGSHQMTSSLSLKSDSDLDVKFYKADGTTLNYYIRSDYIGASDYDLLIQDNINTRGLFAYDRSANKITLGVDASTIYHGQYKVWDESNDGTGSTLDADRVDGKEATAFMYLDGTNSTMTGDLKVDYAGGTKYITFYKTGASPLERYKISGDDTEFKVQDIIANPDRNIVQYAQATNYLTVGNASGTVNLVGTALVNGSPIAAGGNFVPIAGGTMTGSLEFDSAGGQVKLIIKNGATQRYTLYGNDTNFWIYDVVGASNILAYTASGKVLNFPVTSLQHNGSAILKASDKDVNSGIPQLDSSGNLEVKGNIVSINVSSSIFYLNNRTNSESALRVTRNVANDYTAAIRKTSGWGDLLTTADKNIAGGIAGLDGNIGLSQAGDTIVLKNGATATDIYIKAGTGTPETALTLDRIDSTHFNVGQTGNTYTLLNGSATSASAYIKVGSGAESAIELNRAGVSDFNIKQSGYKFFFNSAADRGTVIFYDGTADMFKLTGSPGTYTAQIYVSSGWRTLPALDGSGNFYQYGPNMWLQYNTATPADSYIKMGTGSETALKMTRVDSTHYNLGVSGNTLNLNIGGGASTAFKIQQNGSDVIIFDTSLKLNVNNIWFNQGSAAAFYLSSGGEGALSIQRNSQYVYTLQVYKGLGQTRDIPSLDSNSNLSIAGNTLGLKSAAAGDSYITVGGQNALKIQYNADNDYDLYVYDGAWKLVTRAA